MTIVVDLIRKKNEHHVFNFETIRAIDGLKSDCIYYLDRDASSIDAINDKNTINKIKVRSDKFYFWIVSTILLLKILLSYLKSRRKIILLSATPLQYKLCSIFSNLSNLNIVIFMHGELGYITSPVGLGQTLGKHFLLSALNSKSKVTFVAINEYIYHRLCEKHFKARFLFIEHPLQKINLCPSNARNDLLTIGSFGIHSKEKNSQEIYKLAEIMDINSFLNIQLVTIGVSNGTFDYDKNKSVLHICRGNLNSSLIPKNEFLTHVKTLDFALFFNGMSRSYDLIPSGVFADCIALELPIIALKNPQMQFFFDRYGEAGILCEDINDMAKAIRYLSKNPNEKIKYKCAMNKIKNSFTFEAYRNNIHRILHA